MQEGRINSTTISCVSDGSFPSHFRFLEAGESTKSRTQPHEFPMMATIGTSPVPLAVWTVTTKEYQVKLSCTFIVHTWVSCLVCSFWFRIRQCRNLNVDTHGLIHHHSYSNVLPSLQTCRHFHALGVRSRVFPDSCHGVWLWDRIRFSKSPATQLCTTLIGIVDLVARA